LGDGNEDESKRLQRWRRSNGYEKAAQMNIVRPEQKAPKLSSAQENLLRQGSSDRPRKQGKILLK
jgi:hypothetical protein